MLIYDVSEPFVGFNSDQRTCFAEFIHLSVVHADLAPFVFSSKFLVDIAE